MNKIFYVGLAAVGGAVVAGQLEARGAQSWIQTLNAGGVAITSGGTPQTVSIAQDFTSNSTNFADAGAAWETMHYNVTSIDFTIEVLPVDGGGSASITDCLAVASSGGGGVCDTPVVETASGQYAGPISEWTSDTPGAYSPYLQFQLISGVDSGAATHIRGVNIAGN